MDASQARNKLMSIRYDVETFVRPLFDSTECLQNIPIVSNERCGSWYGDGLFLDNLPLSNNPQTHQPRITRKSCYFKSTDGHQGTWNFSLKRLNLSMVRLLSEHGAWVILDASARKDMPDALSRTIPIWAAVLNRVVPLYRHELGLADDDVSFWDARLDTPRWLISPSERATIERLLPDRVESLRASGAIVQPQKLVTSLTKPIRLIWITPGQRDELVEQTRQCFEDDRYFWIVCVSCSTSAPTRSQQYALPDYYIPGAADDHESWAHGLTSALFWKNLQQILGDPGDQTSAYETIQRIDRLVVATKSEPEEQGMDFDQIGTHGNLFVGSRRSGRPPGCWERFDAILNVTELEYKDMVQPIGDNDENPHCYLQMPVREGKRDKTELERYLALGMAFAAVQLSAGRRVLIHCAQGKDRSVAVAMAVCALLSEPNEELSTRPGAQELTLASLVRHVFGDQELEMKLDEKSNPYHTSGFPRVLVDKLLDPQKGRQLVVSWIKQTLQLNEQTFVISKESLRVTLHLIQQFRECASPTRSTLQKLNRFFMSH